MSLLYSCNTGRLLHSKSAMENNRAVFCTTSYEQYDDVEKIFCPIIAIQTKLHHIVVQLVLYYTPLVFPTLFTTYPFEFRFNFNSYFSIILNNCQLKEDTMQISCTPSFVATNCCVPVTAFFPIIFFTSQIIIANMFGVEVSAFLFIFVSTSSGFIPTVKHLINFI